MITTNITFKNEKGRDIEYAPHSLAELAHTMEVERIGRVHIGLQLCVYGKPDVEGDFSLAEIRRMAQERTALG